MELEMLRAEIKNLRYELHELKSGLEKGKTVVLDSKVNVDEWIFNVLLSFKIPVSNIGYTYVKDAIKMVYEDRTLVSFMTKLVYPSIAKSYNSTPSRVERAIRHVIEQAWCNTDDRNFIRLKEYLDEKPTNSEFIALIAEKMRLESEKVSA